MTGETASALDEGYMRQCLELGRQAARAGEAPVGAIIVRGDHIVSRAFEQTRASFDVTAHAEVQAIRAASLNERSSVLSDCTLYTNVEPCVLCSYAIRRTAIERVVIGAPAGTLGGVSSNHAILTESDIRGFSAPPAVTLGVLLQECTTMLDER